MNWRKEKELKLATLLTITSSLRHQFEIYKLLNTHDFVIGELLNFKQVFTLEYN